MLTDQELQALRNMGNECEAAADEIVRYREALENIQLHIEIHGRHDVTLSNIWALTCKALGDV